MTDLSDGLIVGLGAVVVVGGLGFLGWTVYSELTEPDAGTVTELYYEPAYYDTDCYYSNNQYRCDTTYYPECYTVWFEDAEGNEADHCVKPGTFENLEIGDYYEKE